MIPIDRLILSIFEQRQHWFRGCAMHMASISDKGSTRMLPKEADLKALLMAFVNREKIRSQGGTSLLVVFAQGSALAPFI